jgi:hypothetical protein
MPPASRAVSISRGGAGRSRSRLVFPVLSRGGESAPGEADGGVIRRPRAASKARADRDRDREARHGPSASISARFAATSKRCARRDSRCTTNKVMGSRCGSCAKPFRGFEETGLRVRNAARPVLVKARVTGRKKPDERRTHEIVGRAVDASLTGRVCNDQALRSWILSFGRPARVVPSAPGARRSPGDRGGPASAMRRLTFQMLKVLPGSLAGLWTDARRHEPRT